jgi:predicted phosphodiesterase
VTVRRVAAVIAVVLASVVGGLISLAAFGQERQLSVGRIALSVDPGHAGALDIYVPLVDWGARFDAVRLPARLKIDVRTVNRAAARRVAGGELPDVEAVRAEARDAVAAYIRWLVAAVAAAALAAGALTGLALRGRETPRLRWLLASAAGTAAALVAGLALLLPPRGEIRDPEYYANGPDIPVALRAIERAERSARTLSEELNAQLVGLARLVSLPAERERLAPLPRLTLASDLHNNLLALPTLERVARGAPLLFVGDLTSSGSPFEIRLTRRVARVGKPFVFVSGNHDSDVLTRRLARSGAIVLTDRGRLRADGHLGEVVVRVGGLRVAGYADPFERRRAEGFRQLREPRPTRSQQRAFADWLRPLLGRVDVVMVHEPQLAEAAVEELRARPPRRPLAILTGHTHEQRLRASHNLLELNAGTAGGGGTGNLDRNQPFGVAVLIYSARPRFRPLAADLVRIDAETGSARAERVRLRLERRERVGGDDDG